MDKFDRICELHRIFSRRKTPLAVEDMKTRLKSRRWSRLSERGKMVQGRNDGK